PDGVPGFGPLSAKDASQLMARYSGKVQEVASDIVGKAKEAVEQLGNLEPTSGSSAERLPRQNSELPVLPSAPQRAETDVQSVPVQSSPAATGPENSLQRGKENIAAQNNLEDAHKKRPPTQRSHGGALPS